MSDGCPKCGQYAEDGAGFCGACGRTITECPSCRVFAKKGFACCGVCGRSLSEIAVDEDRPSEKKPTPAKIEVIPDNSAKVCTRCTEFAEKGVAFCGACGSPIKECPRCKEYDAKGSAYCGVCGRTLRTVSVPEQSDHTFIGAVLLLVSAFILLIVLFEAITLAVKLPDILSILPEIRNAFFLVIPADPMFYVMFRLEGIELQIYWVFVTIVILACVAIAIWKFIDALRAPKSIGNPDVIEKTAICWAGILISAMMFINVVAVLIHLWFVGEPTSPDFGSPVETMFYVAEAAFWEEIITRVLYIGVPMMIISLIVTKKKESLRCLLGGFGMSTAAVILIVLSAAIFGMAHYSGWDDQVWKVLTAGIMGGFLGYVFVRFGLYASILLHFITNYLSSFDWMGAGEVGFFVSLALIIIGGLFSCGYLVYRIWKSRKDIRSLPKFRNNFIKD